MRTIEQIQKSVVKISSDFNKGDYVFACKWSDADPHDRWKVDNIKDISLTGGNGRPCVFFETTGVIPYYYAVVITAEEGKMILEAWEKLYP